MEWNYDSRFIILPLFSDISAKRVQKLLLALLLVFVCKIETFETINIILKNIKCKFTF